MRRFFFDKIIPAEGNVIVSGNLFRHMAKSLRLKIGTAVMLADGEGHQCTGVIREIGKESLIVFIEQTVLKPGGETGPEITLYQGLPKGNKMEFILQKSTELGVSEIVPFVAGRSIPRLPKERESERLVRWQKIALEAARQSDRIIFPRVSPLKEFSGVLDSSIHSVKLLLWEKEQSTRLKPILSDLSPPESVAVMVGPEGGLTDEEAKAAMEAGFIPVTLGHRILRTETAAIAILAILQFFWGDVG
ncbi:MAG TPA: 16S rRNA (uracil(1498)-N(3))-methyltransferase [Geobacteraceae bacterium]|nr:16S rRNA (uracil(1498)-N(3))-methyltransferase [Geobacteraceae bacterium]